MDRSTILHHIPNRRVSYNATRRPYGLVNVPRILWQPAGIQRGSHRAIITCFSPLYCTIQLFAVSGEAPNVSHDRHVLHLFEGAVVVTGSNGFIKIHPAIVEAMKIGKGTHCIDWTCDRACDVFGYIHNRSCL